jgi:polynucleotide 5'-hydroxyl-kinase GRC3/NOL9
MTNCSFVGPSYAFPLSVSPLRSHFVGDSTPRSNPSFYLECLTDLINLYRDVSDQDGGMDMVVNTQGWTKGLGANLLASLTRLTNPTHLWELGDEPAAAADGYSIPAVAAAAATLLNGGVRTSMSSSERRTLALLSYLYRKPGGLDGWEVDVPLTHRRPWLVDWADLDQVCLINNGVEVDATEAPVVLNASLVALVRSDDHQRLAVTTTEEGQLSMMPYRTDSPDPSTSAALGLGIVRTVDPATRTFYVLSPLDPTELSQVNVLVKGDLELPVLAMLGKEEEEGGIAGVGWRAVPYLTLSRGQGEGSHRRRTRRNLMRWSQREQR